MRLSIISGAF